MSDPLARYPDLAGKTVFVSGGATGIGRDLVTAFHGQGSQVVFVDIAEDEGTALAAALSGAVFLPCDVTRDDALLAALEKAEGLGGIEVLVNNAANDTRRSVEETGPEEWARAVDVNLRHQFVAARAVCGWMKGRGRGSIVNFGSVAPEMAIPDLAVYSACKAAVRGLTRTLAREMGPFGIRANTVVPGAILTERQRSLWYPDQASIDALVSRQCLPRELGGQDVAQIVLFLASDASAGCTAQDFIVDAGMI